MLRNLKFVFIALGIAVASITVMTNVQAQEGARVKDDSAYKAFGEKAGLVKIMDDFWIGLQNDKRIKSFFETTDPVRLKEQLVEQICEILKGPCVYKGAKMTPLHKEMGINREHFNALVEQLQIAMDKNKVPFSAQNKLLAVLAPMHRVIITK